MENRKRKPTADEIVGHVRQLRKYQRAFFAKRDSLVLRKCKDMEERLDEMLAEYYGENLLINILAEDGQEDKNQLNLF